MGLAAGYIATRRPSVGTGLAAAVFSYLAAVTLHASWNGTLSAASEVPILLIGVAFLFVVLFGAAVVVVGHAPA